MLIHINGWPGTGKRTIGERLARLLDARFLHNHLILDLIDTCSDRGAPLGIHATTPFAEPPTGRSQGGRAPSAWS